jgi:hypothetical protein
MKPATFILLLVVSATTASADHPRMRVAVSEIGPTQEAVGKAIVAAQVSRELDEKPAHLSEQQYLRFAVKQSYEAKTWTGLVDPNGRVRILDGHHRASAAAELSKRAGVPFMVNVRIVQDYRGWSMADYARHLIFTLGKGSFSRTTERRFPLAAKAKSSPTQLIGRVSQFPQRISQLKDNPLRSAVGMALYRVAGFDDDSFVDYFEFKLGRKIEHRLGKSLLSQINALETQEKVIRAATKQLLSPSLVSYLGSLIRPGHEWSAKRSLRAVKTHRTYRAHQRLQRARQRGLFIPKSHGSAGR